MNVQEGLPLSDARVGVVACGALAHDIAEISAERDWSIRIYPLPPLLHNHPQKIADAVEEALAAAAGKHERLAVAYADCGTYGALDDVCSRWGVARLGGQHCYDVYAGVAEVSAWLAREPGTYLLTDYLVASFHRSVVVELGLDRYPELRDDYFGNYRRAIWITQRQTPVLAQAAHDAATAMGLTLEIHDVGLSGLTSELEQLITVTTPHRRVATLVEGTR
jgi:hypothetical protein